MEVPQALPARVDHVARAAEGRGIFGAADPAVEIRRMRAAAQGAVAL